MKAWAVVPAAGAGVRTGSSTPKPLLLIAGRPMIAWTLDALRSAPSVETVIVACSDDVAAEVRRLDSSALTVVGGASRQASVRAALAAARDAQAGHVIVHDAARPLATADLVERVCAALDGADAAVAAVPVADTVKRGHEGVVTATVPRDGLWLAQTPQGFNLTVLWEVHERAAADGFDASDDAGLAERAGVRVVLVPGEEANLKVTTPGDFALAEAILRSR